MLKNNNKIRDSRNNTTHKRCNTSKLLSVNNTRRIKILKIKTPCCNCVNINAKKKKLKKKRQRARDRDKQIKCILCLNKIKLKLFNIVPDVPILVGGLHDKNLIECNFYFLFHHRIVKV